MLTINAPTPPGPFVPPGTDKRIAPPAIVETNTRLSALVKSQGAILVDTFPLLIGREAELVDTDGLHLRPAGYQVLAEAFFAAITRTAGSIPGFRR